MPKYRKIIPFSLLAIMPILLISPPVIYAYHIEVLPTITVGETYDDNLDLESENGKSDYITTISPGITISIDSGKSGLNIGYSPTWVEYYKYTENDAVRQNGTLHFWYGFGKHLRFDLDESYLESEEAIEEDFLEPQTETQRYRHTRYSYQRNDASATLNYKFGLNDHILIGYNHSLLENKDPSLDDNTDQGPFGEFSYWFNVKNGIELIYRFDRVEYTREDGPPSSDDFDGHEASVRYMHSFNRHTTAYANYGLTEMDYKDPGDDYEVHDGAIGIDHNISRHTTLSLEIGYYRRISDIAEDEWGGTYSANLSHSFKHGSISLNGEKNWDDDYLSASPMGFTNYWLVGGNFAYTLLKDLGARASVSYRNNRYESEIEDHTYQGTCGLRLNFLRWYYVDLSYTYLNRRSDDPDDEYIDNKIMLSISASRPFHWGQRFD